MSSRAPAPRTGTPAIRLLLFGLMLVLFGWPVIRIAGTQGMDAMFLYVFAVWAGVVVSLFVASRKIARSAASAANAGEEASHD